MTACPQRGYQLARFQVAWLQIANAATEDFSFPKSLCRCTAPLRVTPYFDARNIYLESLSHILCQAQQKAEPVRGKSDLFLPSHSFHSSVCQHCKDKIDTGWRDLASNWTAELSSIDLVCATLC